MKKKEIIQDEYAFSKGYESWVNLLKEYITDSFCCEEALSEHINAVTDLIQKELLKKTAKGLLGKTIIGVEQHILNTPIL